MLTKNKLFFSMLLGSLAIFGGETRAVKPTMGEINLPTHCPEPENDDVFYEPSSFLHQRTEAFTEVFDSIVSYARSVLPKGGRVYLFGKHCMGQSKRTEYAKTLNIDDVTFKFLGDTLTRLKEGSKLRLSEEVLTWKDGMRSKTVSFRDSSFKLTFDIPLSDDPRLLERGAGMSIIFVTLGEQASYNYAKELLKGIHKHPVMVCFLTKYRTEDEPKIYKIIALSSSRRRPDSQELIGQLETLWEELGGNLPQ